MNDAALLRYSRHILLDEWGVDAQTALAASRVLIIGVGGLGCPAAHALAAAGVGHLTLADGDTVDATNLQRQHLHSFERIGMAKVLSAQMALHAINPLCAVTPLHARLSGQALLDAAAAHDVVLDCSDNFATRYAVNHACVVAKKPLISGAAIRFDGQLIAFNAADAASACYHCVFPELPAEHTGADADQDRCAVTGVFAPLTQQIGTLQAAAALRLLTGVGKLVLNQLQLFNALDGSVQTLRMARDEACAVCGTIT
jgi:molybdopterin-synthase adenylyltransferase